MAAISGIGTTSETRGDGAGALFRGAPLQIPMDVADSVTQSVMEVAGLLEIWPVSRHVDQSWRSPMSQHPMLVTQRYQRKVSKTSRGVCRRQLFETRRCFKGSLFTFDCDFAMFSPLRTASVAERPSGEGMKTRPRRT